LNLVDDRGPFGAQAAAAGGVHGIAFELGHLSGFLVDVGQQAAGGFAVEADGGDELVVARDFARPGGGIVLHPIVPFGDRRAGHQMAAFRLKVVHGN
jgi:hypothetical protein